MGRGEATLPLHPQPTDFSAKPTDKLCQPIAISKRHLHTTDVSILPAPQLGYYKCKNASKTSAHLAGRLLPPDHQLQHMLHLVAQVYATYLARYSPIMTPTLTSLASHGRQDRSHTRKHTTARRWCRLLTICKLSIATEPL